MPARRVALNLPQDLYDKVRGHADRNGRSVNAELVLLVETGLVSVKMTAGEMVVPARMVKEAGCPPHPRGRVIKGFCYRCGRPAT